MPLAGTGTDQRVQGRAGHAPGHGRPGTVGSVPRRADANVTGDDRRSTRTSTTELARTTPLVFGFVLGLAFLLLLVTFRSIVIPIKAIVLNLLSVGAAYGVLVWVFQDGHGESLLGFSPPAAMHPGCRCSCS